MKDKLQDCIKLKKTNYVPIWFMRQAGRYLPEFRKIREKNTDFIKLCLNETLTTKISLQPLKRYDLDAVIIFSDILMILYGLGQNVKFKKNFGPILDKINIDDVINVNNKDFINKLSPIYKAIKQTKKKIKNRSLIGFVGAPWTLLLYMLHGQSPKNGLDIDNLIKDKSLVNNLLEKLEKMICLHIDKQIVAGANVIQIFDSWAGLLPNNKLLDYCYIPTNKIVSYVKSLKIPVICFPKGIKENYIEYCSIVKPNCISIDYNVDPKWIKNKLNGLPIQGGLDPKVLLSDKEKIKKSVENYLNIFKDYPYIFNLGHGVLPNTDPQIINYVIQVVKNKKK